MTQQMSDVLLEQVPWETPRDEGLTDAGPPRIAGARYPELIRHSITVRVKALLSREGIHPWEASGLATTTHTLLGKPAPDTPPELTAAERVEWKSLTESQRCALLDVVFGYLGLNSDAGPRLLGTDGWESVIRTRNALAAGSAPATIETADAVQSPPSNPSRSRIGKMLLIIGGAILMIAGVYGVNRHRASVTATGLPYLSTGQAETGEIRDFEKAAPMAAALPAGLGPVDSVCSGDEIVCSSVKTARPLDAVKALLATIPSDAAKMYRVNVSIRSTDSE